MSTLRARSSRIVNLTAQRGLALSPYVLSAELDPIVVPYGTSLQDVINDYLPDGIIMDLSNGETLDVDISWADIDYDPEIHGDHIFVASYELPDWVWQRKPEIIIKVHVLYVSVDSVIGDFSDRDIPYGTDQQGIGLPATIDVLLSNGETKTNIPVTWSSPSFEPEEHGEHTFTGAYDIYGVFPPTPQPQIKVTVKPAIYGITPLEDITADFNTPFLSLSLPSEITLVISDGTTQTVDINTWDQTTYNPTNINEEQTIHTDDYDLPPGVIGNKPVIQQKIKWLFLYKVWKQTGTHTYTPPEGLTALHVLLVAGGGGGGRGNATNTVNGGSGGGGGVIIHPSFAVSSQSQIQITVGAGGSGAITSYDQRENGQDSKFGSLTAKGGGAGGVPNSLNGSPGGSGGGAGAMTTSSGSGGAGIQKSQSGDSGTYGYGNNGSNNSGTGNEGAGGGAGSAASGLTPGSGITIYGYEFGRGGATRVNNGHGAPNSGAGGASPGNTTANAGGNGGSGIVVIRHPSFPANQVNLEM